MIVDDTEFLRGEQLYLEGRFWDAHEAWEILWNRETDPARRDLVQGLILVAAAIHKLVVMRRPDRAPGMIERALVKLSPLPPAFEGLDVAAMRMRAAAWAQSIAVAHAADALDIDGYGKGARSLLVRV